MPFTLTPPKIKYLDIHLTKFVQRSLVKEIREQKSMERCSMFTGGKTHYCYKKKKGLLSNLSQRFSAIPASHSGAIVTKPGSLCWSCSKPKHWHAKVCSKGRLYLQGSQARRWEDKSHVHLPKRLRVFMGLRKKRQGGLRHQGRGAR